MGLVAMMIGCREQLPTQWSDIAEDFPEEVSYNFHVKPILSDRCFACHGPDEENREADLRLDKASSAYAALADHPNRVAIHPKSLTKSEVYSRLITDDPELMMPPPEAKLQISEREKAIIAKWVLQGAHYENHWSFQPIDQPTVPEQVSSWPINEIDHFIIEAQEDVALTPSDRAAASTLIRRVAFDLTGLPPTPELVEKYEHRLGQDEYAKLVDELLADPAYGERMAADWLDVARYADSDGYLDDKHRTFSPWRDWVIDAFNQNMPYDDFGTWQIAGDLLPEATQQQILATAFNRLHKKNSEAGIVFEEFRVEYVADRTHTFGKAFLGLSVECARCHDHKYDPISQADYYSLFGFFNSTHEFGTAVYGPDQTPGPALLLTTADQEKMIDFLDKSIIEQEAAVATAEASAEDKVSEWRQIVGDMEEFISQSRRSAMVAHHDFDHLTPRDGKIFHSKNLNDPAKRAILKEPIIKPGVKGNAFFVNDYNTITLDKKVGWFERTDPFSVELWLYPKRTYAEAGIFNHCEELRLGYKGYSLHLEDNRLRFIIAHSWPQNALEVLSIDSLPVDRWSLVSLTYDGSSSAEGIHLYLNGKEVNTEVRADYLYKGILFESNIHTYGFNGFKLGYRDKIITFKDGGIDELKIYAQALSPLEILYGYDPDEATTLFIKDQKWGRDYFTQRIDRETSSARMALKTSREKLNDQVNDINEIMVMGDLPKPRPTFVLERGLYDAHGDEVQPGTPTTISDFTDDLPRNRLGLAQWLFHRDNPLTARVFVNRIWQMHFGAGLVKTADDFGAQGALPSHPELLDWLASYFMDHNWDIKKLHKLIVTSATYQQSSKITDEHLEKDPENVFLARAPSPRLTAEMLRDQALAVSGLLVRKIGGPSVYPYQPAGLWDELSNKSWRYPYKQEPGEGLYRRSIYSIYKRTAPPPSMLIFDVPDRSACTVKRTTTSTPLQALVLLNDPQFVEAARVLAQEMLSQEASEEEVVHSLFMAIIGRSPLEQELKPLLDYYHREREKFQQAKEKARAYVSTGEYAVAESLDVASLAALTITGNSIFNTVEAQSRR
ncbi:MAG: DUF1553 domain-containing protein [Saprospiraceae bacterium]|nr:DUF1553 domain-containing protein [Saprospiraceae bacterium]